MTPMTDTQIWIIIIGLAVGTFALRLSFLGLIGKRELPDWLLRILRYTPVAILPGLVAPQLAQAAQAESFDPVTLSAAGATLLIGILTRNAIWAMVAGMIVLAGLLALA